MEIYCSNESFLTRANPTLSLTREKAWQEILLGTIYFSLQGVVFDIKPSTKAFAVSQQRFTLLSFNAQLKVWKYLISFVIKHFKSSSEAIEELQNHKDQLIVSGLGINFNNDLHLSLILQHGISQNVSLCDKVNQHLGLIIHTSQTSPTHQDVKHASDACNWEAFLIQGNTTMVSTAFYAQLSDSNKITKVSLSESAVKIHSANTSPCLCWSCGFVEHLMNHCLTKKSTILPNIQLEFFQLYERIYNTIGVTWW